MQALDGFQTSASAPPHRLSNRHQVQNSYDVGRLILLFFFLLPFPSSSASSWLRSCASFQVDSVTNYSSKTT